jgi:hypothetical protein
MSAPATTPRPTGAASPEGVVRGALADAGSVVVHGFRVIAAHAPVLVVIYLLGAAARGGALWAATVVSDRSHFWGAMLVPLAPLATLTALILMLRTVSPSLRFTSFDPAADDAGADLPTGRSTARERLALLASTLVPFLTVYAAQGYLKEDVYRWINEANADELLNNADSVFHGAAADTARTTIAEDQWLWMVVAVALALRWLVNRLGLPDRASAFGLLAAWLEVTWVTLFAHQVPRLFGMLRDWAEGRVAVVRAREAWLSLVDVLGPVGAALDSVRGWFWGVLGDFDAIVVIPIAWLTVGAVVYGRRVTEPEARIAARERIDRRLQRLPRPVQRWGGDFLDDMGARFAGLFKGLRLLAVAGLVPMLLFCLVFLLATEAKYLTMEGFRWVTGPLDSVDAPAIWPWMDVVAQGVYTVLVVGLLAAAVDRVIRRQQQVDAAPGTES